MLAKQVNERTNESNRIESNQEKCEMMMICTCGGAIPESEEEFEENRWARRQTAIIRVAIVEKQRRGLNLLVYQVNNGELSFGNKKNIL
ncbi:MAG: hypothetical protein ACI8RD_008216 [Bacillariaceae sp.]|jgi:hypothetical protein